MNGIQRLQSLLTPEEEKAGEMSLAIKSGSRPGDLYTPPSLCCPSGPTHACQCTANKAVDVPKQTWSCPGGRNCMAVARGTPVGLEGIGCDNNMPGHLT